MGQNGSDLRQTLGSAARLWASPDHHQVGPEWWVACSGQRSVTYNVACCQSSDNQVLLDCCLQPLLDVGMPAIMMLAGPGLATAQKLAEVGWVGVGALPLMTLTEMATPDANNRTRALTEEDLPAARVLLADTYGLDEASASAAVPDQAVADPDMGVWGLFDGDRMVSSFTSATENGMVVVWSMATRVECQGRGFGRQLLQTVLSSQFEQGATGSLLQSSAAGEKLYRGLGYTVVEYWQLWSRPRWVMGRA
jgi:ribosomal protein S18 acetylase RimI-like enzyme